MARTIAVFKFGQERKGALRSNRPHRRGFSSLAVMDKDQLRLATDLCGTEDRGSPCVFLRLLPLPICALQRSFAAYRSPALPQERCTPDSGSQNPACQASVRIPRRKPRTF